MQPPDITRVFKGVGNEFEVEIVFAAHEGGSSPRESHTYDELIVVTEGTIELQRGDRAAASTHSPYETIVLPKATVHQITIRKAPVKLVIIHPDRDGAL